MKKSKTLEFLLESQRFKNEEFEKMPIEQKRLVVIQDALDSIALGIVEPKVGDYVVVTSRELSRDTSAYESNIKDNPTAECKVCGLGGLLLSTCRFGNILNYTEAQSTLMSGYKFKLFNSLFSYKQLHLIEGCFEGGMTLYSYEKVPKQFKMLKEDICAQYYSMFTNDTDRLVSILYNMLYNNGIFKPEQDI